MRKTLAIRGDKERGNEVIALLKMLGGKNSVYSGKDELHIYFIDDNGDIRTLLYNDCCLTHLTYDTFTLDKFYEKYPYKVGDKVTIWVQDDDIEDYGTYEDVEIESIKWDDIRGKIVYKVKDSNRWFWVDEIKGKSDNLTMNMDNIGTIKVDKKEIDMSIEFDLNEYEYIIKDNKISIQRKKLVYPKTYKECCEVVGVNWRENQIDGYFGYLLLDFQKLLICRDAYWKIAGEEMGLGRSWKPDYDSGVNKFGIIYMNGVVQESNPTTNWERHLNKKLDFPSEEMRDAFYENFKDLIEECKELL